MNVLIFDWLDRVRGKKYYRDTWSAKNNASAVLLTWVAQMEITFVSFVAL